MWRQLVELDVFLAELGLRLGGNLGEVSGNGEHHCICLGSMHLGVNQRSFDNQEAIANWACHVVEQQVTMWWRRPSSFGWGLE